MSIKIDAPKVWLYVTPYGITGDSEMSSFGDKSEEFHVIRKSDYRKLMAVVKAADAWYRRDPPTPKSTIEDEEALMDALYALERHLEKRK